MAKKRSLFDDNPVEVNELTFIIKQDLSRLNEEIRNLQALSKRLHPKPDQEGENNKNILLLLQGKLGDVSANFKVRGMPLKGADPTLTSLAGSSRNQNQEHPGIKIAD